MAWTQSDAKGDFEFSAVAPGDYVLYGSGPVAGYGFVGSDLARDQQLQFGSMAVSVSADTGGLLLTLGAARQLRLRTERIRSAGRDACPDLLRVRLVPVYGLGASLDRTVHAPVGEVVEVDNLAPVPYRVEVAESEGPCRMVGASLIDLVSGSPSEPVRLTVASSGALAGRVLDAPQGQRLQAVLVPLDHNPEPQQGSLAMRIHALSPQGVFRFEDLPPGRYRIAVRRESASRDHRLIPRNLEFAEVEVLGGVVEMELYAPGEDAP